MAQNQMTDEQAEANRRLWEMRGNTGPIVIMPDGDDWYNITPEQMEQCFRRRGTGA